MLEAHMWCIYIDMHIAIEGRNSNFGGVDACTSYRPYGRQESTSVVEKTRSVI